MSEFIIDIILPTKEVHLIGGPSGAGKSTWLLQMMDSWSRGEDILGHASHPLPFVYVSADRSKLSVDRLFARLKMDITKYHIETMEHISSRNLITALRSILARRPDTRVFFVEGIQTFTPNHRMNDYGEVSEFIKSLVKFCVDLNLTIIGVCHATKTKKDESYENPRQRIAGSVAWAAFSETIIYIEPDDASDPENKIRSIDVLPRNSSEHNYKMEFRDGRLIPKVKPLAAPQRFDAWLYSLKPGEQFTTGQGELALKMAKSTFAYELARAVRTKLVLPLDKGLYQIVPPDHPTDA